MSDDRPLIAHVVYRFDVGGLENGVVNLINGLPSARFRHMVVALTACVPAFCERVRVADVRFVSLHKPPGHGAQIYPALYRLFRETGPAIVHTRNLAALEASVPAWAARVPVRVHGEHGWDVSDPDGTNVKLRLVRRLYRPFVTHYIALSRHLMSYLTTRIGVPASRATRICNGVDTARFSPVWGERAMIEGSPFTADGLRVIGTVGRLQPIKDQLNLVEGFARFVSQSPELARPFRLLIAGDGPLRGELEALIARHALGARVWLAGERRDVPEVMRGLALFVLPSRAEGISNTILEAMACGLPVIATRVGGNPELVADGETGWLVPPADPAAIGEALVTCARDPSGAARMGQAAREVAEREFSLDGMMRHYADLYDELLVAARGTALAY